MQKELQFQVDPEVAGIPSLLYAVVAKKFGFNPKEIRHIEVLRKSIDARKKPVKVNLKVQVYINEDIDSLQ